MQVRLQGGLPPGFKGRNSLGALGVGVGQEGHSLLQLQDSKDLRAPSLGLCDPGQATPGSPLCAPIPFAEDSNLHPEVRDGELALGRILHPEVRGGELAPGR